jgi:hypothetical protein
MSPDPVAAVLSVTLGFAKDGFIPTPLIVLAVDILLTLARVKPEALDSRYRGCSRYLS